jgi:limonene 1,2-monooxygenase
MEFGIFSNSRRPTRTQADTWEQDILEIKVADELGFEHAWISEHESPAELIICKAAAVTQRIRLGSAVRPLAYHHPLQVAIEANACDQLTNGRYQLGIGFGFYAAHMERRGLDFSKTREMMHASIELILKLWAAEEPIDYDGPFWHGKQAYVRPRPVQSPHPPVAVAAANSVSTIELAARHDFRVLTGDFIPIARLQKFGNALVESQAAFGKTPSRRQMSCTRVVYVAETDKQALDEMRESYTQTIKWEIKNTSHHQIERVPPGGTLDDISFDYLVETGNIFVGSADTVYRRIREFYDAVGGFGLMMIHAGRDYATAERRAHSMRLFMEQVAPRLRPLDPDMDEMRRRVIDFGSHDDSEVLRNRTAEFHHFTPA